jgi:hypothetical protein
MHCYAVNAMKLAGEQVGIGLGSLTEWGATTAIAIVSSLLVVRVAWRALGRRAVYAIGSSQPVDDR